MSDPVVRWILCECGKAVDEFETVCHWCRRPVEWEDGLEEVSAEQSNEDVV